MMGVSTKATNQAQILAMTKIAVGLCERTMDPDSDAPPALLPMRPDSRLRYMMFCISTVQAVCARRMSHPDEVLNECARKAIAAHATEARLSDWASRTPSELDQTLDFGIGCLQNFLHRWSTYVAIGRNGRREAATSILCSMLFDVDSADPAEEGDGDRLWPLALWIEGQFGAIDKAFVELCGSSASSQANDDRGKKNEACAFAQPSFLVASNPNGLRAKRICR
jgi:hypothetical protein